LNKLKNKIKYCDKVHAPKIQDLSYASNFTHAHYETYVIDMPKIVTHLTYAGLYNKLTKNNIPSTVTHLTFGGFLNQQINDCIPRQ